MTKEEELLDKILKKLENDFDALDPIAESVKSESASNRRLETLSTIANSRNKLARSLIACIYLKGDPKYRQLLQGADKDIARIVRDVIALGKKEALMTYKEEMPQKTRLSIMKEIEDDR